MWGLSAPVRASIAGMGMAIAALAGYNYTSRPTTQTVEGIDNRTLMVLAAAAAFIIWVNR